MRKKILQKIKSAPKVPGVYIFYATKQKPIYIGKANNLKSRLLSYKKITDFKIELLHKETVNLKYVPLQSEIEALITESKLIKELKPKYNIVWRDDKSYLYVAITKNEFSKIFVIHESKITEYRAKATIIGPFTESKPLRLVLKLLRRSFPYCTCKSNHFRICLNAEIENCAGFCCKMDLKPAPKEAALYKKNIRIIKKVLLGTLGKTKLSGLSNEEKNAVKRILAHKEFIDIIPKKIKTSTHTIYKLAECYDISHFAGKESVGAMTAWTHIENEWVANKNLWRKFKIRTAKPSDDTGAIKEVLERRFKHTEWEFPDLVIIDGGVGQLNTARKVFKNYSLKNITLISFAKPEQKILGLYTNGIHIENAPQELKKLVPKAIAETHRFAIAYHRKMRSSILLKK